jgi:hypothetical protein
MESTKDDRPLKARFFVVRKEIYNHYEQKQQTEQQAASAALERSMSERERDSEVIEVDNDITLVVYPPLDARHMLAYRDTLSTFGCANQEQIGATKCRKGSACP